QGKGDAYSVTQAVEQWLAAKWPAEKLVLGTPFYGRSVIATEDMTKDPDNMYVSKKDDIPQGDQNDAYWYDSCAGSGSLSGVWQYANLRKQGVLTSPTVAGDGWFRYVDKVSQTPWLYNKNTGAFISYDDPDSLTNKAQYAKEKGLKGMMTWSLNGDYQGELLGALNKVGPLCRRNEFLNQAASLSRAISTSSRSSMSTNGVDRKEDSPTTTTITTDKSSRRTCRRTGSTTGLTATSTQDPATNIITESKTSHTPTTAISSETMTTNSSTTCDDPGKMYCMSEDGTGAQYRMCLYGKWYISNCGTSTACYTQGPGAIYCGFPKH
ncbi:hypothetical protein EV182_005871, partial [Spiromyces aspiralis]